MMKILTELEFLVVSLDHIGSAELSEAARKSEVYDFVIEGGVLRRLAAMRKVLWATLDHTLSRQEQDVIERRLEKVTMWKLKH